MIEGYSLELSLFDFVPNVAFLVGALFLVRTAQFAWSRRCAWLMTVGTLLVFLGGTLKAIWKLFYTIGVGDVRILSEAQFVMLAPGFLLLLMSVVVLTRDGRPGAGVSDQSTALALVAWKIPFLVMTTLFSISAYGLLTYLAFRRGAHLAGMLFIVAVLCLLAMSGMAGAEQTIARQWIEQGINSVGQGTFAMASFFLYRAYLHRSREMRGV
jgi:hypothetical protein